MKHISFNPQFMNAAGNDLIPGKIHTIRKNYEYWKRFEGREVALFTWEGKPYRSKQKVFCIKRIVSVQELELHERGSEYRYTVDNRPLVVMRLASNDGFIYLNDFSEWFADYKPGKMAIIHFTDFRY